jgi:hypothetical protein
MHASKRNASTRGTVREAVIEARWRSIGEANHDRRMPPVPVSGESTNHRRSQQPLLAAEREVSSKKEDRYSHPSMIEPWREDLHQRGVESENSGRRKRTIAQGQFIVRKNSQTARGTN